MLDPARTMRGDGKAADDPRVRAARRLFQRTLAAWVGDLLVLRRAGALDPRWRPDREDWA